MIIFLTYSIKSSLSTLNEAFHFTNSGLKLLKKNNSEIHKRNSFIYFEKKWKYEI